MGDRIIFRERGEGLAQKTSGTGATSITEPRVRFRKGWLTGGTPVTGAVECGEYTAFPLRVTMAELHEIAYSVYDAVFTQGSVGYTFSGRARFVMSIKMSPGIAPVSVSPTVWSAKAEACTFTNGEAVTERGLLYGFAVAGDDLSPERDHLLDTRYDLLSTYSYREYDVERPSSQWDDLLTQSSYLPSVYQPGELTTTNDKQFGFRHVFMAEDTVGVGVSTIYGILADTPSLGLTNEVFGVTYGHLNSSLEVAYFGADDPYDAAAILYLNLEFSYFNVDCKFSTSGDYLGAASPTPGHVCNLILRMSGDYDVPSDPSYPCKIYSRYATAPHVDFICEARRWWPYETTDGLPAIDTDTGTPINGGVGA